MYHKSSAVVVNLPALAYRIKIDHRHITRSSNKYVEAEANFHTNLKLIQAPLMMAYLFMLNNNNHNN